MIEVVDNYLNIDELNTLKDNLISDNFPLYYSNNVTGTYKQTGDDYWNYYFFHTFYEDNKPQSNLFDNIYNIFIPKFEQKGKIKSLLRIKLNYYPHTETLREHGQHVDDRFSHHGAVFSLNTCDGFTRLYDGTKVNSIENRILFFDPSIEHNSSTTTNSSGRWNINFNFI